MSKKTSKPEKKKRRVQGEGSIYPRKDGVWVASMVETLPDGSRKRRVRYARSSAEALARLEEIRADLRKGLQAGSQKLTVGGWLDSWLSNGKTALRPKTYTGYEYQIRVHLKPGLGKLQLRLLQPQHVRDFITAKLASGLSNTTVRHLRATLRTALNAAIADGLMERNAAALAKGPSSEKAATVVFTPDEARRFLAAIEDHRLEALFTVVLALGLRIGEALGLKWSDLDLDTRRVSIERALQRATMPGEKKTSLILVPPKSKTSRRKLDLPLIAVRALLKHRMAQEAERAQAGEKWSDLDFVFTTAIGTPIDPRNVAREADGVMKNPVHRLPRLHLHALRHCAASLLIAQGRHPREIMEHLGHSRIALTMDLYGHIFDTVKREMADAMDEALGAPTKPEATPGGTQATKVATKRPSASVH